MSSPPDTLVPIDRWCSDQERQPKATLLITFLQSLKTLVITQAFARRRMWSGIIPELRSPSRPPVDVPLQARRSGDAHQGQPDGTADADEDS